MGMKGVVIWVSRRDLRAIIWCEDSKNLGIANGPTAWRNPLSVIDVGDCVAFSPEQQGRDRVCRDIRLVESQSAPTLSSVVLENGRRGGQAAINGNPLLHLCASRD